MNTPDLTDPALTYCPHCKKNVIPRLTPDRSDTSGSSVEVIGTTHLEQNVSRHFHGECPQCGHHLYSHPAEELNKSFENNKLDSNWEGILLTIGAIVLLAIVFFIFN
jgi:hypothetical protein